MKIDKGKTPSGYVWHHHEGLGNHGPGTMQLVKAKVHNRFLPHTGGRKTWGGNIGRE